MLIFALSFAAGLAFVLPASAEPAQPTKPKKQVTTPAPARVNSIYRGTDKFRAGPLYYGQEYLGDDPDPFIRLQIQRDLGARFPGND
jgi:hypothetical protein